MIAAGGTGGHVFPGLAVARRLRERGADVVWLGSDSGMEVDCVPCAGLPLETVGIRGLRRKGVLAWLVAPWRLSFTFLQALRILLRRKPDALLGFGGFAAAPGGVMAAALGIPLLIHEQNAVAGLTNRWLARISDRVLLGFPGSIVGPRAHWVGNPVRAEIAALPPPEERMQERVDGRSALRLFVIGGSLGAAVFNEVVPAALAAFDAASRPQVKQQAGRGKLETARANAERTGVEIEWYEFIDDVAAMYAWADLVLCRAGASSVAEVAAAGVAAVFVPYPYAADDHQAANARFLESRGAAIFISQSDFTPDKLASVLRRFIVARSDLLEMAVRARQAARPAADAEVADWCLREIAGDAGGNHGAA